MAVCNSIFPAVSNDQCAPNPLFGRINRIYFTRQGDGLTNWADPAEWATRIDNVAAAPTTGIYPIREICVIGSKAAPETSEIEISCGRKVYTKPSQSIAFRVDDLSDDNYEFFRDVQANSGAQFTIWFEAGGKLYGGNDGIQATMNLSLNIPESKDELKIIEGTISWDGYDPERIDNPIAA